VGVRRPEDCRRHGNDVHQGHAHDAQHVPAVLADGLDDRRLGDLAVRLLLHERGGLVDAAPDDVAGDHDADAEEERDPPAPRLEGPIRHPCGQREEDGGRDDLPSLGALQREAAEVAAPAEGCVFQDHCTGAGQLAAHGEALDQPEHQQQDRCPDPNRGVGRQDRDEERRRTHQQHGQDQHVLAAVLVAPVSQEERTYGPRHVAHAERGERRHDGDRRVALGEEDVREDQRGSLRVDEEVVVFQRAADLAAGRRLLRRFVVLRWLV
jgi:hypothetical protein